ncbi:hypothetical protein H9Y04_24520 [Streptomyces sp. TRM66268-LWL]|uniref:MarR family transcriptional regulator n=1 Tax=Streptomyces polyasparticus TaxID=2767826 RepID=A0ABR7SK71_9ACTN|nr:hypothetical protein [Streptomyces polyasparticus]MBC9715714.1 hypothetical protein [Streptomyces polyasparticus]
MTPSPTDAQLFEVTPPPTPVERLLHLADQYTQHNDALDLLLRATDPPAPDAHAASAQHLAADTQSAIKAIQGERLYESTELTETVMRLKQLTFLASASADLNTGIARELTALAPEAAVSCAMTLAAEARRRRWATAPAPDDQLNTLHRTALAEIACGHVVSSSSLGREFTRSREPKVLMSTLRSLETKGLAERTARSAPAAYIGGPPLDRVRLTSAGITALASVIDAPPARPSTAPGTTPRPLPAAAQAATRSR